MTDHPKNAMLIHDARIITPERTIDHGWLLIQDGLIVDIETGSPSEVKIERTLELYHARGQTVIPGFIDIHVHGAVGHDSMDASPEGFAAMASFFSRHGVTGFLAATWTKPFENIYRALKAIDKAHHHPSRGAILIGAHLEGPFLNPEFSGAQDRTQIHPASAHEFKQLLDTGIVRLITCAPEIIENQKLIKECMSRGIVVSIGHSNASYDETLQAVEMGARSITHCFNAMRPFHHREPGILGAAFLHPDLSCELIVDRIHVHPAAVRMLVAARGLERIILVTDAIRACGLADGIYDLDGRTINVQDGKVLLDNGTIAGSVLTMDAALRNFMEITGKGIEESWRTVSWNPARLLSLDKRKGTVEIGKDADLVVLSGDGAVLATIIDGRMVYKTGASLDF
jgi:N-acetylglucosamine-6-phosphate deacetylase